MWLRLRLFLALVALARALVRYLRRRQEIALAEADAALEALEAANAIIARAVAARRAVDHDDPDGLRDDPRNRDEDGDGPSDKESRVRKFL